jgi:hypothetical protein
VYGGATNGTYDRANSLSDDFLDVYVLSLPAFTWFKSSPSAYSRTRRASHTCEVIGKRQMIVIGGDSPVSMDHDVKDPWSLGIGIFDMSKMSWSDSYDPKAAAYEQPTVVQQWYATRCACF